MKVTILNKSDRQIIARVYLVKEVRELASNSDWVYDFKNNSNIEVVVEILRVE